MMPKQMPTPQAVGRYIDTGGPYCLFCGSTNLDADSVEIDVGGASQDVRCVSCGEEWTDHYDLARISVNGEVLDRDQE